MHLRHRSKWLSDSEKSGTIKKDESRRFSQGSEAHADSNRVCSACYTATTERPVDFHVY
jgi:hypothetical protein